MKKFTKWENVCVRYSSGGIAFLLQKRVCENTGETQFINRNVNKLPKFTSVLGWELFHKSENTLPDLINKS